DQHARRTSPACQSHHPVECLNRLPRAERYVCAVEPSTVSEEKKPHPYRSPACLLHELEELPQNWEEIKAWRRLRRTERIKQRLGRDPSERRRLDRIIVDRLIACLERSSYPVLGIYSPIRGEVDVREIA